MYDGTKPFNLADYQRLPVISPKEEENDMDVRDIQPNDAVLVVVSQSAGKDILRLMEIASKHGFTDVMVAVDTEDKSKKGESQGSKRRRKQSVDQNRILYLNGHPLLNTRLIV